MDAFIVLLLVIVIICWACYRRKLSKAAYGIASLDIFLRIASWIASQFGGGAVDAFLTRFPNSLLGVAGKYTSGIEYLIIAWAFIILMIYFLFLTLSIFFKK